METYQTKKKAVSRARTLRAEGKQVRILRVEGVYTVPGKGITSFVRYEVHASGSK